MKEQSLIADKVKDKEAEDTEYFDVACYLAKNYAAIGKQRDYYRSILQRGPLHVTEDMLIRDLSLSSSYSEFDRVQTSNISNPSERISGLMDRGYLQNAQWEADHEYRKSEMAYRYACWKQYVIDVAMKERMSESQRVVFREIFIHGISLRGIQASLMPNYSVKKITGFRKKSLQALSDELRFRAVLEDQTHYVCWLLAESTNLRH